MKIIQISADDTYLYGLTDDGAVYVATSMRKEPPQGWSKTWIPYVAPPTKESA